ncbi:U32 family peptidase [Candidatus Woesearchaeota archaeon]|nr:U32 family peptidase [Candidatus Woesearchaeota archaeon]
MFMVEILAPVGNWEMLAAAIEAGADAVYFGTKLLNMRATANNFELTELNKVVDKCHENNVKAYLTINTIVFDDEIEKVKQLLDSAKDAEIDAIICWDHAVLKLAKELGFEIHLSTQASIANFEAIKQYHDLGVKRFILARELSLEQIRSIKQKIINENLDIEIETFIHGAMCVAVSGRCFVSQFLFEKSANRGSCLHPCRRTYRVTDIEEGHELELDNNYVMSAKDLCTLPFIEKLVDAGIDAFKIEGRNKTPEYVKTVVECYREVIDFYIKNKEYIDVKNKNEEFENKNKDDNIIKQFKELKEENLERLKTVFNRKFSSGFYLGLPTSHDFTDIYGSASRTRKEYIGVVRNFYSKIGVAEVKLESGELRIGDKLLVTGKTTGAKEQIIGSMEINHEKVQKAGKGKSIALKLDFIARPNDKVFNIRQE